MIERGMFLYFVPPRFGSGEINSSFSKRIMLVLDVNTNDDTLKLINVSKIKGKPNCFTYKYNVVIRNYAPLVLPSFAKLNDNYIIENFQGLDNYLYKSGTKLDMMEFNNIVVRYNAYIRDNQPEVTTITEEEFKSFNS